MNYFSFTKNGIKIFDITNEIYLDILILHTAEILLKATENGN